MYGCTTSPVKGTIYVKATDTVFVTDTERIMFLEHKCHLLQDSLNIVRDSLGKDLFIANYKLSRIKYYNNIAAKGNNIKYLRGWINRVINK